MKRRCGSTACRGLLTSITCCATGPDHRLPCRVWLALSQGISVADPRRADAQALPRLRTSNRLFADGGPVVLSVANRDSGRPPDRVRLHWSQPRRPRARALNAIGSTASIRNGASRRPIVRPCTESRARPVQVRGHRVERRRRETGPRRHWAFEIRPMLCKRAGSRRWPWLPASPSRGDVPVSPAASVEALNVDSRTPGGASRNRAGAARHAAAGFITRSCSSTSPRIVFRTTHP